jgi:tRNA threonylcarbamoyladenosine biosynthesis protein TsaE
MNRTFGPYGLAEIESAARFVEEQLKGRTVLCLHGEPGSGKTTLVKALCRLRGVEDNTSSPTFALVNEYREPNGSVIYHIDAYRLRSAEEAFDIGAEEYLRSGHTVIIEWPEVMEDLLPENALHIHIRPSGDLREMAIAED